LYREGGAPAREGRTVRRSGNGAPPPRAIRRAAARRFGLGKRDPYRDATKANKEGFPAFDPKL
jgi:hypothetical protein